MVRSSELVIGRLIHPGRLRLRVQGLRRNPWLAGKLEQRIAELAGVIEVKANPKTGTVLATYRVEVTSPGEIKEWVADVLGRISAVSEEPRRSRDLPCTPKLSRSYFLIPMAAAAVMGQAGLALGIAGVTMFGRLAERKIAGQASAGLGSGSVGLQSAEPKHAELQFAETALAETGAERTALAALAAGGLVYLKTRDLGQALPALTVACSPPGPLVGQDLEDLAQADTVLFNSVRTLTTGLPQVRKVVSLVEEYSSELVIALAAAVGNAEDQALARVLVHKAEEMRLKVGRHHDHEAVRGPIVRNLLTSRRVLVGCEEDMKQAGVDLLEGAAQVWRLRHEGAYPLYVAVDSRLVGLVGLDLPVSRAGRELVETLRLGGIRFMGILSHEPREQVESVAADLGLDQHWAQLAPGQQEAVLADLSQKGHRVILVDGASPEGITGNFLTCRRRREIGQQNTLMARGFSIVGLGLAAAGLLSPWQGLLFYLVSTTAVLGNSARGSGLCRPRLANHRRPENPAAREVAAVLAPGVQPACEWYRLEPEEVLHGLGVNPNTGISTRDYRTRLATFGPNKLAELPPRSFWSLLKEQLNDFMVKILLGSLGVSLLAGKTVDAMAIAAIVLVNSLLGVLQEQRAEKTMTALNRLSAPSARVLRAGVEQVVPAEDLVNGDIILLETGDRVPADAVIIEAVNLATEESSLTGEPAAVWKKVGPSDAGTPLGDRMGMVFMGTGIAHGRGRAVVVSTGMATEMGQIAGLLGTWRAGEVTPLQTRLARLGHSLVYSCLAVCGVVFVAGFLRGGTFLEMFLTSVSLAVAAIPEGLTAIVTIALALGVHRMGRRSMIVRRLQAVETLGSATVICADKTGTITRNEMTVKAIYCDGRYFELEGEGYSTTGEFIADGTAVDPAGQPALKALLTAGVLCSNARLSEPEGMVEGDSTEAALLVAAAKAGLRRDDLEKNFCRQTEIPFCPDKRKMTVICNGPDGKSVVYVKGAPDVVLPHCDRIRTNQGFLPLAEADSQAILETSARMGSRALRVLAVAYDPKPDLDNPEKSLTFLGLVGIMDPPRTEVRSAVAKCRQAGVRVVMITGDQPATAVAIAKEIGLLERPAVAGPDVIRSAVASTTFLEAAFGSYSDQVLTGAELDQLSDVELAQRIDRLRVCARASPQHKLRLVRALRARGHVVAMTGDGVNDAPAVKEADIGIVMGQNGTEVAKEVSSMVITDDNFATIVTAVEEGRVVYTNIRKSVRYLLSTNVGEVTVMLASALLGLPLPLAPIQLLWINLAGDGIPAVALVADPAGRVVMDSSPTRPADGFFTDGLGRKIISRGLFIGLGAFAAFSVGLGGGLILARTMALASLGISQFTHLYDCRWETGRPKLSNPWLLPAGLSALGLVVGVIQLPFLGPLFQTVPLSLSQWGFVTATSLGAAGADYLFNLSQAQRQGNTMSNLAVPSNVTSSMATLSNLTSSDLSLSNVTTPANLVMSSKGGNTLCLE